MPDAPEQRARENIDRLLNAAGWAVQDRKQVNLFAARGVVVREFPLAPGYGFADYLLFVDGVAVGALEAKKEGDTLTGVEFQTGKYSAGLPDGLAALRRPLPFCYQSTGKETRFTNLLEPDSRSRPVFSFHRPGTLDAWLTQEVSHPGSTLRARLKNMPPLIAEGLWPAQARAIRGLEASLAENRPRALIQMATGSGKTFTACNFIYRLIKFAGARRVLFLVDRRTLGRQAMKEFQQFVTPDDGRKFTDLYNAQHLVSNTLDSVSRVTIGTIQRVFSMLKGDPGYDDQVDEASSYEYGPLVQAPVTVSYNPAIPIETFDFIVTDECHRSIYNLWRQVLDYFDAFIIGLTATPSRQTLGFFNRNLVMEYNHEQAVADGVNVDFDVYRIRTSISEHGAAVSAGFHVDKRDRQTRAIRYELLDRDLAYTANQLDRDVVATDQIRTVIRTFRNSLFTELFPGRKEVPKTLIFAKDDSHADDIVQIVREEFGKGNDFAQKITYRTKFVRVVEKRTQEDGTEVEEVRYAGGGEDPEELLASFRNSYYPRIVVTVDMIATGTDVKPLEVLLFMRDVRSLNYFEQMKGRGVRVVSDTDFQAVTPDAPSKTHFVIVDAVGLSEGEMIETRPLERQRTVSFEKLLEMVAFGSRDKDVLSSLASRLARLDRRLTQEDRQALEEAAGGSSLQSITAAIVAALDPDIQLDEAKRETGGVDPAPAQVEAAARKLLEEAARPIASNPVFRNRLVAVKNSYEQTIDTVSRDTVLDAGFSADAKEKAKALVTSFEQFVRDHKDEITALQILYSKPYAQRLTYKQIKELAEAIRKPHPAWTPEALWRAYETLDRSKVRGSGPRVLTDIVSLVRHAIQPDGELRPFPEQVKERFAVWLSEQEGLGRQFTEVQLQWLEAIAEHIGASAEIAVDDFDYTPFAQRGGMGKAYQVFGEQIGPLLQELNEVLVA